MRATLPPPRVGHSLQMIVILGIASWGLVFLVVQIGQGILAQIGGAL